MFRVAAAPGRARGKREEAGLAGQGAQAASTMTRNCRPGQMRRSAILPHPALREVKLLCQNLGQAGRGFPEPARNRDRLRSLLPSRGSEGEPLPEFEAEPQPCFRPSARFSVPILRTSSSLRSRNARLAASSPDRSPSHTSSVLP